MRTLGLLFLAIVSGGLGLLAKGVVNDAAPNEPYVGTYQAQSSPSRRFIALSGTALGEVSPTFRMRMRILVVDVGAVKVREIRPWVEGKWVVVWAPDDTLVVCGRSDDDAPVYLISAYECHVAKPLTHRFPTDADVKLVIDAFRNKYGKDPTPVRITLAGDLP